MKLKYLILTVFLVTSGPVLASSRLPKIILVGESHGLGVSDDARKLVFSGGAQGKFHVISEVSIDDAFYDDPAYFERGLLPLLKFVGLDAILVKREYIRGMEPLDLQILNRSFHTQTEFIRSFEAGKISLNSDFELAPKLTYLLEYSDDLTAAKITDLHRKIVSISNEKFRYLLGDSAFTPVTSESDLENYYINQRNLIFDLRNKYFANKIRETILANSNCPFFIGYMGASHLLPVNQILRAYGYQPIQFDVSHLSKDSKKQSRLLEDELKGFNCKSR